MNYEKICIRCMKEKSSYEETCPFCGFDPKSYTQFAYILPPLTILNGKYLIGEVLGSGGFGITYAALDLRLRRRVAIKEFFLRAGMSRDTSHSSHVSYHSLGESSKNYFKASMDYFEKEAILLAQLEELPGIVRVHEIFNENLTLYIVMEYLKGMTLRQYARSQGGRVDTDEMIEKISPIMESLVFLHEKNILHRDISPDNIMVLEKGGMKLFDFGGAKILENQNEQHSAMVLKKNGFSPIEQLYRQSQGPWTDEYALAATIYFCITAETPPDSGLRILEKTDPLESPSALGVMIRPETEDVLLKALSIRRDDRYPDIRAFKKALLASLCAPSKFPAPGGAAAAAAPDTAEDDGGDVIDWKDAGLEAFMRKETGIPGGQVRVSAVKDITELVIPPDVAAADLSALCMLPALTALTVRGSRTLDISTLSGLTGLKSLTLADDRIRDVSALAGLANLTELSLDDNGISDLAPLSALAGLTVLSLGGNDIRDVSPLSEIPGLTKVFLDGNKISDVSPLSALTHLTELHLRYNQVSDISPLAGLADLTHLYLDCNRIRSIAEISGPAGLTELSLSENRITDISGLSVFTNLVKLYLDHNDVRDLSPLAGLTKLTELWLHRNGVTDISPLSGLTRLEKLQLQANRISDLTPLERLGDLRELNLQENRVSGIASLSGLTALRELRLGFNEISGAAPLARLSGLRLLWIGYNKISSTEPLSALSSLRELWLDGNEIRDVAPLSGLGNLKGLWLRENEIRDVAPLGGLTELSRLYLADNPVPDLSPVAGLALEEKDF